MNINDFNVLITMQKKSKPILFGLDSDKIADEEDIELVEEFYNIKLPSSYKEFVHEYGGGYFAHSTIFSCDSSSDFYIIRNNPKEFVKEYNFIAIADLETGDLAGYHICNNTCDVKISIYDHEKNNVKNTDIQNLFEYIAKYGLKLG